MSLSYSAKILQIQESSSSFHFPDFSLKTPDFNFSTLEIFNFLNFSVFQPSKSSNFQSLIFDFFQLSRFDFLIYSTYNFQNSSVFQLSKSFKVWLRDFFRLSRFDLFCLIDCLVWSEFILDSWSFWIPSLGYTQVLDSTCNYTQVLNISSWRTNAR